MTARPPSPHANEDTTTATTTTAPKPVILPQQRGPDSCKSANFNSLVRPLLTDLYQITMCYAYWRSGKHSTNTVFDLFFRKNPFKGEYTIFAGLHECIAFIQNFRFSQDDVDYIKTSMPNADPAFFEYLLTLDCSNVTVSALPEGSVCFPRVPLIRIEGPLAVTQLLETTLLVLVNFACLVTTNAVRFRNVAGPDAGLLEFGLRRAQGPDGGVSASRYCYMGGFNGTSNVLAGQMFGIPVSGTHAHAYITSFINLDEVKNCDAVIGLPRKNGSSNDPNFYTLVMKRREDLRDKCQMLVNEAHQGELAAFIAYAATFPQNFIALVDTYDTLDSGMVNFCSVALALFDFGYAPLGLRIDSGDLAYFSLQCRALLREVAKKLDMPAIANVTIVVSNDINEDTLESFTHQPHEINAYGIGTHLVTCQRQPALGGVYKMVEIGGKPRIKLSQDIMKVTLPCKKTTYRLFGKKGHPICDLIMLADEEPPRIGQRTLARHPFEEQKRAWVLPTRVDCLTCTVFQNGVLTKPLRTIHELRDFTKEQVEIMRDDHLRALNPTPYKVSVSTKLYNLMHDLWLESTPVGELE